MKNGVVILGAGLSGLSAAYHLNQGYEIYEKESRAGGLCRSVSMDGFTFDYGPHILYSANRYASELIQCLLKDNLLIKEREAWIYHKALDSYTRFPFQAHLYGLPLPQVLECLKELFYALTSKEKSSPRNYEEWMYRVFGKGIAEYLMIPYAKKIWTVDPREMNCEWINRRVPQPKFEVILEGALAETKRKVGFNNEFWYPLSGGIEALPRAFLNKVNNVHLNMMATRIFPMNKQMEINGSIKVAYDCLISTLPLPEVVEMIKEAPGYVKKAAQDLKHNSILCVNLGIDREKISNYHWLYFYEDTFIFHRISFPMNISPATAPAGKSSVSCEIAYSKWKPVAKESIIERTIDDLIKARILRKSDYVVVANVVDLSYGYVIYDLAHRKNVDIIHFYLAQQDIHSCGRFGEWEYFNMDDSIGSGKKTAEWLNDLYESEVGT